MYDSVRLSFYQGPRGLFLLAEEILTENDYPRVITASDRATMLNLMVGLNGYTLCSGIICEELNGTDYIAIPFRNEGTDQSSKMEIAYIKKKGYLFSEVCEVILQEIH